MTVEYIILSAPDGYYLVLLLCSTLFLAISLGVSIDKIRQFKKFIRHNNLLLKWEDWKENAKKYR